MTAETTKATTIAVVVTYATTPPSEYTVHKTDEWGAAYDWVRAYINLLGGTSPTGDFRSEPTLSDVATALRDGEMVTVNVYTDRRYIHLGNEFSPTLIGTVATRIEG